MPHPLFADDGRSRGSCYSRDAVGWLGPTADPSVSGAVCVRTAQPRPPFAERLQAAECDG